MGASLARYAAKTPAISYWVAILSGIPR